MSLDNMFTRIQYAGGVMDNRVDKSKLHSMQMALQNSYQAEWITLNDNKYRCLINPDKLKEDYDQKVISIEHSAGMKEGDVFYWDRTDTHWLVYLQQHSESAYFRAQIRRCNYEIEVNNHKYWVYLRGPVETALVWRQKHNIEFNDLNYSLLIYVTKNEETLDFFKRFQILKIDGHRWRVAATDIFSQGSIIEVYLEEFFDNPLEEEQIKKEPIIFGEEEPYIDGPQFVEPYQTEIKYSLANNLNATGTFLVSSKKVKIVNSDNNSCIINVISGKAGEFKIIYREEGKEDLELNVTIESF